nr:MAG TPA: hypothetical protein [Caudoviricetes sp.]
MGSSNKINYINISTELPRYLPLKREKSLINIVHKRFFVQAMLACCYLRAELEHPHDNKANNSDLLCGCRWYQGFCMLLYAHSSADTLF